MKTKNTIKDEKWFLDRVWKRIYRNMSSCKCSTCMDVFHNWLVLLDKNHATYVCDAYHSYLAEWEDLNYRDEK